VRDRDNLEGSQGWRTNRRRALLVSCGNPKTGETQHDRSRSLSKKRRTGVRSTAEGYAAENALIVTW